MQRSGTRKIDLHIETCEAGTLGTDLVSGIVPSAPLRSPDGVQNDILIINDQHTVNDAANNSAQRILTYSACIFAGHSDSHTLDWVLSGNIIVGDTKPPTAQFCTFGPTSRQSYSYSFFSGSSWN